ncbi:MAG: ABC transporter ATP-binding protein, partial [Proteobacteria bacterium]|nr:ABC transporter ATP-binding protein [Pseudomonadota bacterium]
MLMSDPSSAPKPAERPEAPEPERPQFKKFFKRAYILSSLWLLAASCLMLSVPWYIVQIIDRGI